MKTSTSPCPTMSTKICFLTVGATASFSALIEAAVSPAFLTALESQGYTELSVQYGQDGKQLFEKCKANAQASSKLTVTGFDLDKLGLGKHMRRAKETVRMSCESFESQAQNKRFLGETIGKLLAEAKDPNADSFEDVPLDLRHVENKRMQRKQKALLRARLGNPNTGFPVEWRMTPERRAELDEKRAAMLEAPAQEQTAAEGVEGEAKVQAAEEKKVVSGLDAIEEARKIDLEKAEAPLMAEARAPLAKGKQGKKEFGQGGRSRR